jgi:hypothetical protein
MHETLQQTIVDLTYGCGLLNLAREVGKRHPAQFALQE